MPYLSVVCCVLHVERFSLPHPPVSVPGRASRSVAGVIGTTLVYVLPGSVRAVNEYLAEILPTIEHSLLMLSGIDAH